MSDLSKTLKSYVQEKNLDNKNNLVLLSTDLFLNEVKKNQKVIIDVDRSYIKQFVQIGSSLEYGKKTSPQRENFKANPKSNYSKAKFLSTNFLIQFI